MPKGKKGFIDKRKAVTFRLTPAVDTTPKPVGDPEIVNVVEVTEQELAEREKYGIYYGDNYNYMSHLKAKDEVLEFHLVDRTTLPESSVRLPTNILEIKGKEIPLDFSNAARPSVSALPIDGADEIDPEVMEMLNAEEEIVGDDDDMDELEDNFLELAGGVDMPEGRRIFEEYRRNGGVTDSEDEDDTIEEVDEDEAEDGDVDMDGDAPKPILKPAPANANKKELDERFNDFYANMEDSDPEDDTQEDDPEVDERLLGNFALEYEDEKERNVIKKPDPASKEFTLKAYQKQASGASEELERVEIEDRAKKPKWDCESITSFSSTLYNHPTIIPAPRKRKSPLTAQNLKELDSEKMDCDAASVATNRSTASTIRPRGETTEERRERKKAIKEERRERRIAKKDLKLMFKDEKKLKDAQRGIVLTKGRPLK